MTFDRSPDSSGKDNDGVEQVEDPVNIPVEVALEALRKSDGTLCWAYRGLGRGWHLWHNRETGEYEVAVSQNVPKPTDKGVTVAVEVKQHWSMGSMDVEQFWPERWHARIVPVGYYESPFPKLDDPEPAPRRVPNGE